MHDFFLRLCCALLCITPCCRKESVACKFAYKVPYILPIYLTNLRQTQDGSQNPKSYKSGTYMYLSRKKSTVRNISFLQWIFYQTPVNSLCRYFSVYIQFIVSILLRIYSVTSQLHQMLLILLFSPLWYLHDLLSVVITPTITSNARDTVIPVPYKSVYSAVQ